MKLLLAILTVACGLPATALAQSTFNHPPVGGGHGMPGSAAPAPIPFRMPSDMAAPAKPAESTAAAPGAARAAPDMLVPLSRPQAVQLPNSGTVISVMTASGYSYVEVSAMTAAQGNIWLAGPEVAIKPGDRIRYDTGSVMRNFPSRSLGRTFAEITFVNQIVVESGK